MEIKLSSEKYVEDFDLGFNITHRKCKYSYVYSLCYPDGIPFYIGIGKRDRYKSHFQPNNKGENPLKDNIILKINRSGQKVKIKIIAVSTCRDNLIEVEKFLIDKYGRRDIGTGILSNMTEGGDGVVGKPLNENQLKSLKEREPHNKGKKFPKSFGEKVSKSLKEHYKKLKEKGVPISSHRKGAKASEETKKKQSEVRRGVPKSKDHVKNQALSFVLSKPDYLVHIKDLDVWYYVIYAEAFVRSFCCPTKHTAVLRRSISKGIYCSGIRAYRVDTSYRNEGENYFYPISHPDALKILDDA